MVPGCCWNTVKKLKTFPDYIKVWVAKGLFMDLEMKHLAFLVFLKTNSSVIVWLPFNASTSNFIEQEIVRAIKDEACKCKACLRYSGRHHCKSYLVFTCFCPMGWATWCWRGKGLVLALEVGSLITFQLPLPCRCHLGDCGMVSPGKSKHYEQGAAGMPRALQWRCPSVLMHHIYPCPRGWLNDQWKHPWAICTWRLFLYWQEIDRL